MDDLCDNPAYIPAQPEAITPYSSFAEARMISKAVVSNNAYNRVRQNHTAAEGRQQNHTKNWGLQDNPVYEGVRELSGSSHT